MSYKPNDSYFKEFTTASPSTGAAVNADILPAATANKNGTDDAAFVLTVANIDTGRYKITGTIPAGYAAGGVLNITIAATVGGIAGKAVVDTLVLDSKRVADLNDIAASAVATQLTAQGYTSSRATKLDNLDAAVSTRSTFASGGNVNVVTIGGTTLTVPGSGTISIPSVVGTSTFAGGAVASVTAPVTVGTNTDKTGYSLSGNVTVGGYASGQDPAKLVLDVVAIGHNTPNTIGGLINAPGGVGADPWTAALPGNYASGTAGAIVGGFANPYAKALSSLFPPNFAALSIDPSTGGVKVAMNMDKSDYLLASSGLDAIPVETGVNVRQALSPILAATAGVVSGAGTGTIVIKGGNVPDTRIKATTDKAGNRTAVTLTLPPASFVAPGSATSYYFPSAYFPKVYFPIGKSSTQLATS